MLIKLILPDVTIYFTHRFLFILIISSASNCHKQQQY
ncbi:Hypothetical protein PAU_00855 [Photorhabdus asymbiotica]|uniref:Uncharacterized protein n=1 Tax=Photorhabdus asymbiotica subsp. asymbiotica (strain ATCC 43949 / 3105-77) TaxID=553480 RepID=C7BMW1_PHOAA|nr:Hypothetical protein PAU_00855 [Photorhabdus asymbiotica]